MAGGLTVTTETQSGISGGPPGNNTTQTTVAWLDDQGNGCGVGMIPAYGGALVSPWYEFAAGVRTITQTSLATSNPDGFIHLLAQSPGAVFTGTEDPTFTLTELAPSGGSTRRGYDSGTITPSTGPALSYRVRTWIWAGADPFLYFHRIDVINSSGTAVSLAGSDGLEIAMLGGLTQASQGGSSAWIPGNGLYATVGGTETAWPASPAGTQDPDYVVITPTAGSGLKLSAICVRRSGNGLAQFTGATSPQIAYLTNASRLKVKVQVTISSFPGSTTMSCWYMEARRRNYSTGEASSIAADYISPDAGTIVSSGFPASPFFNFDEGCYTIGAAGNAVNLLHTIPGGNLAERWVTCYKITGYTASAPPVVSLAGAPLAFGTDYTADVDTGSSTALVRLFRPLVASGATGAQMNNGMLAISASPRYSSRPVAVV